MLFSNCLFTFLASERFFLKDLFPELFPNHRVCLQTLLPFSFKCCWVCFGIQLQELRVNQFVLNGRDGGGSLHPPPLLWPRPHIYMRSNGDPYV